MAKPTLSKSPSPAPPSLGKRKPIHGYRLERLSTFEYQCYRSTKNQDGTVTEELFGKPSLFELVSRKAMQAAYQEANDVFNQNKKEIAEKFQPGKDLDK